MVDKFDLLINLAMALEDLSSEPNTSTSSGWVPLENYDGEGKIFEAFTMVLLAATASPYFHPHDWRGELCPTLYLRGAPGHIHRGGLRHREDQKPGHIRFILSSGVELEIHNSAEWPDRFIDVGEDELDISIATTATIDCVFGQGAQADFFPLMGVECKFEATGPDISHFRHLKSVASSVQPAVMCLFSKQPAQAEIAIRMRRLKGSISNNRILQEVVINNLICDSSGAISRIPFEHMVRALLSVAPEPNLTHCDKRKTTT